MLGMIQHSLILATDNKLSEMIPEPHPERGNHRLTMNMQLHTRNFDTA